MLKLSLFLLKFRHMALEKEEFKKQCDAFYAEIVAEYYFARKNCDPLKLGVIKKILDFVFSVHSTSNSFSKASDVAFGVLVDSTPIVCSFLLQKLIEKYLFFTFRSFYKIFDSISSTIQFELELVLFNKKNKIFK